MGEKRTDSIIVLAWPETYVVRVGMWYDYVPHWLGISKNGYYQAGHAAAVIVNHENGFLHYMDFGRYHTPIRHGRVRDFETDPDLMLESKAKIDENNHISNIDEILLELSNKEACHGDGTLFAGVSYGYSYKEGLAWAKHMQNRGSVKYGPFEPKGTNCSRFIASLTKAGKPAWHKRARLSLPLALTPLPVGNILASADHHRFYTANQHKVSAHYLGLRPQIKNWIIPRVYSRLQRPHKRLKPLLA